MFDKILDQLKSQVGPQLMQKAGLNEHQTNGSINAAAASVRAVSYTHLDVYKRQALPR